MANEEHLKILKQGVKVWNEWRAKNPSLNPDLSMEDLQGARLNGVNFQQADLSRTDLRGSYFSSADFGLADLESADLGMSRLDGASLERANLFGVEFLSTSLIGAILKNTSLDAVDLVGADLTGADLTNTNFSGALIRQTVFGDNDLSVARGLDNVTHLGPSFIGINTIYRSKGNIPEAFLRGAGVPEDFIKFMRSLVGKVLDFYSCFISHSTENKIFCDRLYADLQANNVRTWYFPEDAKWGESVWGEIDRGIKLYDKLVVICSKDSLRSGPVLREIERALSREDREGKSILFPIRIDDYLFEAWKHERKDDVLRKVVGDFRRWEDHDRYQKAFARLLRDLKAEDAKPDGKK